jgi:cardiolipin synthase
MPTPTGSNPACEWLRAGNKIFPALLAAIDAARESVCLEIYIYRNSPLGIRFREALLRARERGARVRVLVDAIGSISLPGHFWDPLRHAGGEVRVFNPLALRRVVIRNHRKLLVCDGRVAFIGGFNVSPEYEGDGVKSGWYDVGLKLGENLVPQLQASFDDMFERAEFQHKHFIRLRKSTAKRAITLPPEQIFLSGPGWGHNPFQRALQQDLKHARQVQIMMAYFLPPHRLARALRRVVRRGGKVQLALASKSDVPLSLLAARSLYRRLLAGGVEIYEYQPQILHAKLIIVDQVVYAGSSNLDTRSLHINYELMIRFDDPAVVSAAREIFASTLEHCHCVTGEKWSQSRTVWQRLKQHWAYFLLNRIDPYLARWQWRGLPD